MSLEAEFRLAGRNTYLRIDLDAILHNWNLLQNMCSQNTEMIAVLKANACGHGSVPVARHLYDHGVKHFAVATPLEGVLLRQAGLHGFIQIFGSNIEAADSIARFQLTPTVSTTRLLDVWAATNKAHKHQGNRVPAVVLKVDSGMSRHGCQIQELEGLVKHCHSLGIPIHSVMTHFANAWGDHSFTKEQLDSFLKAVKSLRQEGMKIHVANCPAMFKGVGVDLDFVRPGICIYGMPPDMCDEAIKTTIDLGFRPALRWLARPTLIKELPAGRQIGYSLTYRLQRAETIATFNFGYADSYSRRLSNTGVLSTQSDGAICPVVGRVSMDAVTAIVDKGTSLTTPFVVYADNFSSPNCVTNVCRVLDTIPQEVCALLPARLPRVYVTQNSMFTAHN